MTPEQHEIAARELCRLRGVDPDSKPHYDGHNTYCYGTPMWRLLEPEIVARDQMDQAMRAAACEYMADGKCDES